MKHEKLYALLDSLDDDLVLESAEVKKRTWKRRLTIALCIFVILSVVYVASTWPIYHPPEDVGGTAGFLQDGVYYVYAGSGFPIPGQTAVPRGIWKYVPGQGKELLVDTKQRPVFSVVPEWSVGVNSHSLYYTDRETLWRLDLETREETVLFQCSRTPMEQALEEDGLWRTLWQIVTRQKSPEELEALAQSPGGAEENIILSQSDEEAVTLTHYLGDEAETLTLDGQTGAILRRTPLVQGQGASLPFGGHRYETVFRPKPGQEDTSAEEVLYDMDLLRDGVSVVPKGWIAEDCRRLGDALLLTFYREHPQPDYRHTLVTAAGETYDFTASRDEADRLFLTCWDGWLFCTEGRYDPERQTPRSCVTARRLDTGETRVLLDRARFTTVVSDGTWLYSCDGSVTGHTDCWRIDWDEDGQPVGLTLVEEHI